MTIDDLAVAGRRVDLPATARRLVVAWQHPVSRLIAPVAFLDQIADDHYRFRYLRRATRVPAFRPFLGFPDLTAVYDATRLFPLFAQRVMSPRRPDFGVYMHQLRLDEDATPWEQIARSEGRRTGDTVQVFPVPQIRDDGSTTCLFLVHGIRHVIGGDVPELTPGEPLVLEPDPENDYNARALYVCDAAGTRLGYVPDLLLPHVEALFTAGSVAVSVEHRNGPSAPVHLRLLARMDGRVPTGYGPMTGPAWETFVD